MRIISGTTNFICEGSTAAAIGKFDGVHRGHRKLLEQILAAKADDLMAVVFTFDPSPAEFFSGKKQAELTTKEEKRRLFEEMGIDILIEFPMNAETAAIPPEDFIRDYLCERMQVHLLAAGTDLSFGYQGKGNWYVLNAFAKDMGYQMHVQDKLMYEGREISSTFIREELRKGNMKTVTKLLGTPYSIIGHVMHGQKLGRTIGMPTLNLLPGPDKMLPPNGVYFSKVKIGGEWHKGITNIGCRPTVSDSGQTSVETYLYDFNRDIYDEFVEVRLHYFQRPEMRFSGIEELKSRMEADLELGRAYWKEMK